LKGSLKVSKSRFVPTGNLLKRKLTENIKIRFFEYDDEQDTEVWEGYGRFSELDVHHQYAIVFK